MSTKRFTAGLGTLIVFCMLGLFCFTPASIAADSSIWTPVQGSQGADAYAFAADGTLYLARSFKTGNKFTCGIEMLKGSSKVVIESNVRNGSDVAIIQTLAVTPNGELYIGGFFNEVAGLKADDVAKWNGSSWAALRGDDKGAMVRAFAIAPDGTLYVGGKFGFIDKCKGATCTKLQNEKLEAANVESLAVTQEGTLYVAFGTSSGVYGELGNVAKWDGKAWSYLDSKVKDGVGHLVTAPDGTLYQYRGDSVARWNGKTWSALGPKAQDAVISSLAVAPDGTLYIGRTFSEKRINTSQWSDVAKWNGTAWVPLGSRMNDIVRSLVFTRDGTLYAQQRDLRKNESYISKWNGVTDSTAPLDSGSVSTSTTEMIPTSKTGTTKVKDRLPLEHGMFVVEDVACEDASNADILSYDGQGISSAHISCRITNVSNNGNIYQVKQKCVGDGGVGGNAKIIEIWNITIKDKTTWVFDKGRKYRFCANPNGL